ncbi:type II secretion system protein GspD [Jeongeupia chitinilytica]|uniref:Bacteriophage-related lipoprotein n=1 Tax=Jeongeupia chitinilytica TaxID=1041641 RepID=A0ABQ3H1V2_9NEIS|nr:type II secretory pathway protein [Jeongeupia chitinilytica]GHD66076.1 bacteriophage-related lipoprotein [Jeongeupia chitinilytica]
MKKLLIVLITVLFTYVAHAKVPSSQNREVSTSAKFDFQSTSISQVIQLVYAEALKQPYVIDPAVLQDARLVSFRFDTSQGDLSAFWRAFMRELGYTSEPRSGVDFVKPLQSEQSDNAEQEFFVYRPKYRSVSYLTDLLGPLFQRTNFSVNRAVRSAPSDRSDKAAPQGTAAAAIDHDADTLVYRGSRAEIANLKRLLIEVDQPAGDILVKGVVYEVTTNQSDGSAFQLALSLLGGKLGIQLNTSATTLDSSISFKSATIDAVLSALSGDSRFKVVSTPELRVTSGRTAKLTVGQDVPILGSVSYPQGGSTPVRSVDYRSSGVIFSLTPQLRDQSIALSVTQQVSNFAKTETGVNDSPTLTKRELSSEIATVPGELVLLGGLTDDQDNTSSSGLSFLPGFLHSNTTSTKRTQVIMMLQLTRL